MKTLTSIIEGLTANGILRKLCIMGGEPLCPENLELVRLIVEEVKEALPDVEIYIWTGYLYEELLHKNGLIDAILSNTDYLIDGPYIEEERDISLPMRGSRNQRIIKLKEQ